MNRVTVTRAPKDGQDGVSVNVTPPDVVHREGATSIYKIYVDVRKGATAVSYYTGGDDKGYRCSVLSDDGAGYIADNIKWTFGTEDGRFFYRITVRAGASGINMAVPFTVTLDDVVYSMSFSIVTVTDGARGNDGPMPRGPRNWADISDGEVMYDGSEPMDGTDIYIRDIVLHNGYCWLCVLGHVKSSDNEPQVGSCNWRRFQSWDLVATQLLLAEDAVIENGIIRNLATDIKPNKRVEIRQVSNDIKIFDASGNPVSRMSGDTYTPAELFGAGGDTTPSSVGTFSTRLCYARQDNDTTSNWGGTYLQSTLQASSGLLVGKLRVKVEVTNTMTEYSDSGSGGGIDPDPGLVEMFRLPEVTLQLWVGDTVVWSHSGAIADTTVDISYSNHAATVPVKLTVTCRKGSRCTGTWTASVYAALSDMRVDSKRSRSLIFKEGLAVGASSSQYLMAFCDPNGVMAIKGRSGAAGFMCYKDSIYLRFAQGGWQRLSTVTQGTNVLLKLTACTEPSIDETTN